MKSRNLRKSAVLPVITGSLAFSAFVATAGAQSIGISPAANSIEVGQTVEITVNADTGDSVARGGALTITFDDSIFSLVGGTGGVTKPDASPYNLSPPPTLDDGTLGIQLLEPGFGTVSHDGPVAVFTLEALGESAGSDLAFTDPSRFSPEIANTTTTGATIEVTGAPVPMPSISISPATGTFDVGQTIDVTINADTEGGLARGGALTVMFDDSILELVGGTGGVSKPGASPFNLSPPPTLNNGELGIQLLEPSFATVAYEGPVATFQFEAIGDSLDTTVAFVDPTRFSPELDNTVLTGASYTIEEVPNVPPTVTVTVPAQDETVSLDTTTFAFSGSAADTDGTIDRVEYIVNDGPVQTATGTTSWSFNASLDVGENDVLVRSVDDDGAQSTAVTRVITRLSTPSLGGEDILVLTEFTDVWFSNNTDPTFDTPQRMRFTGFNHDIANDDVSIFGDLNDDGLTDILTIEQFGSVWTAINQGDGNLGASTFNSDGWSMDKDRSQVQFVGLDFNGDGMMDLLQLSTNTVNAGVNVLGSISAPQQTNIVGLTINANIFTAAGDFNGDGFDDVFILDNTTGSMAAIFGAAIPRKGINVSAPAILAASSPFRYDPDNQQGIAIGDFNGDGNDDVAFIADTPGTNIHVALTNGAGTALGAPTVWAAENGFHDDPTRGLGWWVFAGDMDDNGVDDLMQNTQHRDNWVSFSNGNDGFDTPFKVTGLGFEHKPEGRWQIGIGEAIQESN